MRDAIAVLGSGPGLDRFGTQRIRMAVRERQSDEFIVMTGSTKDTGGVLFAKLAADYAISIGAPVERVRHMLVGTNTCSPDIHGDVRQLVFMARVYHITRYRVITERPHWIKAKRLLEKSLPEEIGIEFLDSGNPVTWKYWIKELIAYAISFLPPRAYSFLVGLHHRRTGGGP